MTGKIDKVSNDEKKAKKKKQSPTQLQIVGILN